MSYDQQFAKVPCEPSLKGSLRILPNNIRLQLIARLDALASS